MLLEALEFLVTPCPPVARRFGYLAEAVALGARYRRQRAAWAPHVAACHAFVMEAAERAPAGGRAALIGSGRLIEVPLDRLAARFDEVLLVDLVHTPGVRLAARRLPNVHLLSLDATGLLVPLAAALARGGPLPAPAPPPLAPLAFGDRPLDFAVSCNLLSQLPLLPLDAIARRAPRTAEAERAAFARRLVASHLRWLAGSARHAALFSDLESLWMKDGRVVERDDSSWGLAPPPPDLTWDWAIAPAPEEEPGRDLHHRVGAWFDVGALATLD